MATNKDGEHMHGLDIYFFLLHSYTLFFYHSHVLFGIIPKTPNPQTLFELLSFF